MNNISEKTRDLILKLAIESNFYGKRLASVKRDLVFEIIGALELDVNSETVYNWLEANKPAKPKAAKKAPKFTPEEQAAMLAETHSNNPRDKAQQLTGNCFIITSAQNSTDVNESFLQSLQHFARQASAELLVIGTRYFPESLNGLQRKSRDTLHYDSLLISYMITNDLINDDLSIFHSAMILPTAKQPVNSAEKLNTGEKFTVVGSPKQQLKNLPRGSGETPRYAMATGSVTVPNYSDSRAGAEASAAHCYGAIMLDFSGSVMSWATIEADAQGCFYCNEYFCTPDGCERQQGNNKNALVLGDLHAEAQDQDAEMLMTNILDLEAPETVILHDILHMQSSNPHEKKKSLSLYKYKHQTIEQDLLELVRKLYLIEERTSRIYCVESNHNDMLERLINDAHFKPSSDPKNAKIYHKLSFEALEAIDKGLEFNTLQNGLNYVTKDTIPDMQWGQGHRSEIINGYDVSQHGHVGTSGSRGSVAQIAKIARKLVTGHTHSGAITTNGAGRVLTVGTSASLDQGYNRLGFTTWDHSYAVIYPNGTASLKCWK